MKLPALACFLLLTAGAMAQTDTTAPKGRLTWDAYVEAYYAYDFARPASNNRPAYVYSHNRTSEVNINLAYLKLKYTQARFRATLGLMAGTYSNANMANEPGLLKNIFEAHIGVRLSKKQEWWVDAGVLPSHIGFESAVGKDCATLTRSIAADNSPYFETGVRLSYTSPKGKVMAAVLVVNGWQRIQLNAGSTLPSAGWQVQYKPNGVLLLNSSGFVGTDKPDTAGLMRYFHNFYSAITPHRLFNLTLGFDCGIQQKQPAQHSYSWWLSPVVIAQVKPVAKLAIAARYEYYVDKDGVIVAPSVNVHGISLNLDYHLAENILWRLEGKMYTGNEKIFRLQGKPAAQNYLLTTALAVNF